MLIVDRHALMKMPPGTMYFSGREWVFGELCVKGDTINSGGENIDWGELSIPNAVGQNAVGIHQTWDEMFRRGRTCQIQTDWYGRNGCFDDTDRFMVLEPRDLDDLMKLCLNSLMTYKRANENQGG